MKVLNLSEGSKVYTSNVYLITGNWNALADVNTLIDVGRDPAIMEKILNASTGVGKKRISQVIITHNHYDHTSMLKEIKDKFKPVVYAFSESLDNVDILLKDGQKIPIGDGEGEIIHTPGHSQDSVCIYVKNEEILFTGDTPLIIRSKGTKYEQGYIDALKKLKSKKIETVYPGHGSPWHGDGQYTIEHSLKMLE